MNISRKLAIAFVTILAVLAPAAPAFAGSGGQPPTTIVAPAGFEHQYNQEQKLVWHTCADTRPRHDKKARAEYAKLESHVDRELAKKGLHPSPSYDDWANLATSPCPKG